MLGDQQAQCSSAHKNWSFRIYLLDRKDCLCCKVQQACSLTIFLSSKHPSSLHTRFFIVSRRGKPRRSCRSLLAFYSAQFELILYTRLKRPPPCRQTAFVTFKVLSWGLEGPDYPSRLAVHVNPQGFNFILLPLSSAHLIHLTKLPKSTVTSWGCIDLSQFMVMSVWAKSFVCSKHTRLFYLPTIES